MKAIKNKHTGMWKFGDSGEYIYLTEQEAEIEGKKELAIKLNKILDGNRIQRGK